MASNKPSQPDGFARSTVHHPSSEMVSTRRLEANLRKATSKAAHYEYRMKDLEARLSDHLDNFRRVDVRLQEAIHALQLNSKKADRASNMQIPRIRNELNVSMEALTKLEAELPVIRSQVNSISDVYRSGHRTAKVLVSDLEWLNTDFYERWRRVIFTSTSPVPWRWKAIMRSLFVVSFMICVWLFCITLAGAYRAHRHRLVWGDKLMS